MKDVPYFPNPDDICQSEYRAIYDCVKDGLEDVPPGTDLATISTMLQEFSCWAQALLERLPEKYRPDVHTCEAKTEKQGVCLTCGELVPQGCCTCGPEQLLWPVGLEQCGPFIEEAKELVKETQSPLDELVARSYLLCLRQRQFQLWCIRLRFMEGGTRHVRST